MSLNTTDVENPYDDDAEAAALRLDDDAEARRSRGVAAR